MKIIIEINDCQQCPFCESKRIYTKDNWEEGYELTCSKSENKIIAGFKEWNDKNFIPDWCPQKI